MVKLLVGLFSLAMAGIAIAIFVKAWKRIELNEEKLDMKAKVDTMIKVLDVEAEIKKVDVNKVRKARSNVEAFKKNTKEV